MESFEDDHEPEDEDREVGYKKPPKHSRFKKGQSGNPRGKPRGTKNSATLFRQAVLAPVLVKRDGRPIKTTKLKVVVTRLVHSAMKGDYYSIRLLFTHAGLDRLLNEPEHELGGLSAETADAIRRAIAGDFDRPEMNAERMSNEIVQGSAKPEQETRSRTGIRDQSYKVGYRKPPEHTRFQKGHSGNPLGRPRAPKSFRALALRMLDEEVYLTENGQRRVFSKLAVIFAQIANKAAMGDHKFLTLFLEYMPSMENNPDRGIPPEVLERAKILVRGRLDEIDI